MYLDAAKKQEIFGKYGKSNTDTVLLLKNLVFVSNPLLAAGKKISRFSFKGERLIFCTLVGNRTRI